MPSLPFERRLTIFGGVDVVYCSVMVGLRGETPLVPPCFRDVLTSRVLLVAPFFRWDWITAEDFLSFSKLVYATDRIEPG